MPRRWTKVDDRLLMRRYPTGDLAPLAADLDRTASAICSRAKKLGVHRLPARKVWTDADRRKLVRLYPDTRMPELMRIFGASERSIYTQAHALGAKRSAAFLEYGGGRLNRGKRHSPATEFKPGQVPFNKGIKGWDAGGRSHQTRFKTGQLPHTWKPIGTEVVDRDGYRKRKISDDRRQPARFNWQFVHLLVWEKHYGPVPTGHAVVFRDGDRTHITIDNLECISRADLARRNSIHRLPAELKEVIRLKGTIKATVTKRLKRREKQNGRSAQSSVRNVRSAQG